MFYYYFPRLAASQVTREFLLSSPIAGIFWDLLASASLFGARIRTFPIHANGPDGSSGLIVAAMPNEGLEGPPPGMRAGQTWVQIGGKEDGQECPSSGYWLGFDELPDPMGLQREHLVAGEEHEMGDGRIWLCPVVRRKGFHDALPSKWGADPQSGDFTAVRLPQYSEAWDAAGRIFDSQISGEITRAQALVLCVQMLAINYRIGLNEATALGLFDDTTWQHVWRTATDAAFVESWIASQASDGSSKKD